MRTFSLSNRIKDIVKDVEIVLLETDSVSEAMKKLQDKHLDPRIIYFYVVDEEKRLKGIIPTRKLILCEADIKLSDVMERSVIKLKQDQTIKDAMECFAAYNLLALPVVDDEDRLLGVIDVDMYMEESFDIADARHRSDIFQLIGLSLEDEKKSSLLRNYRLRMPWIFCSMFGGIICAIVSRFNETVLSKALVLAMFIPLVLSLSESVSMQSMTHSIHFIRRPRFSIRSSFKRGIKEWQLIGLIALSCAIIVGLLSLLWGEEFLSSFVIGCGIFISIIISASFGLVFPIILHKIKLDPKVASGPIVLMLADIITTALYLGLATWWIL